MPALARLFLFPDNLDEPAPVPAAMPAAPPPPEPPPLTEADLARARAEGFAEGSRAGRAAAEAEREALVARALEAIAGQLEGATATVARIAEESAMAIARLVMDTVAIAYPTLAARYGEAELRAFIDTVLPPLSREPEVTIHVHPALADALAAQIAPMRLRKVPQIIPDEAIAHGNGLVLWENGLAERDAGRAWTEIAQALRPLGLLSEPAESPTGAGG
jgi:flagellar assembly protein FliH